MAYRPKHSETWIHHSYDRKIQKLQNFQKKYEKNWIELWKSIQEIYPEPKEFFEALRELMGTKRYYGNKLTLIQQYNIIKNFKKLYSNTFNERI
jgi:hypothetical protein